MNMNYLSGQLIVTEKTHDRRVITESYVINFLEPLLEQHRAG